MIRDVSELIENITASFGENLSDANISLLEDVQDTYNDLTERVGADENWKKKYEENDAMWRDKYVKRFQETVEDDTQPVTKKKTEFSELFKED